MIRQCLVMYWLTGFRGFRTIQDKTGTRTDSYGGIPLCRPKNIDWKTAAREGNGGNRMAEAGSFSIGGIYFFGGVMKSRPFRSDLAHSRHPLLLPPPDPDQPQPIPPHHRVGRGHRGQGLRHQGGRHVSQAGWIDRPITVGKLSEIFQFFWLAG